MSRQVFNDIWASGGSQTDPGATKWATGWIAEKPPFQYFNFWQNKVDQMLQHLERFGIPVWHASTSFQVNGLCQGSDGAIYQAVAANTNVNPVGSVVAPTYATANWKRIDPPATESAAGILQIANTTQAQSLTDDVKAMTPKKVGDLAASTTQRGISRFATTGEAAALSNATIGLTPAALAAVLASTTQLGIVQLATATDVVTGTATNLAVTPQALGALNQNIANPGYKKFPGGLILQWGSNVIATATNAFDVTLPIAFPTAHLVAIGSGDIQGVTEQNPHGAAIPHPTSPLTQVRLQTGFNGRQVNWLCIGK